MKEIARKLGISQTTVSFILNNKAEQHHISKDTKQKVLDFVEDEGYVPDVDAINMSQGSALQIGIFLHKELTENQKEMFFSLVAFCMDQQIVPVIQTVVDSDYYEGLRFMLGKKVQSIVFIGHRFGSVVGDLQITRLLKNVPSYILDYHFPLDKKEQNLNSSVLIGIDRENAYEQTIQYLYDLGHREIMTSEHGFSFIENYDQDGMKISLLENHINYNLAHLKEYTFDLIQHSKVTALLFGDDVRAIELMDDLLKKGVCLPEEMSIIGFDNMLMSRFSKISLSSIEVPIREMAEVLKKELIKPSGEKQIILPSRLIVRESVARPRTNSV